MESNFIKIEDISYTFDGTNIISQDTDILPTFVQNYIRNEEIIEIIIYKGIPYKLPKSGIKVAIVESKNLIFNINNENVIINVYKTTDTLLPFKAPPDGTICISMKGDNNLRFHRAYMYNDGIFVENAEYKKNYCIFINLRVKHILVQSQYYLIVETQDNITINIMVRQDLKVLIDGNVSDDIIVDRGYIYNDVAVRFDYKMKTFSLDIFPNKLFTAENFGEHHLLSVRHIFEWVIFDFETRVVALGKYLHLLNLYYPPQKHTKAALRQND